MKNVIEIDNLTKYYGKHRGVTDVSFQVAEGDIFGFLGPNGAGKSTTIRSMLGLIRFQKGSIRIFDKDIRTDKEAILSEVGYMPSETMFYPAMKVKEMIQMAAEVRGKDCRNWSLLRDNVVLTVYLFFRFLASLPYMSIH